MESGGGSGGGWGEIGSHNQRGFPTSRDFAAAANDKTGSARLVNVSLPRSDSRTLLDIIREEGGGQKDSKKSWRHFKEKLKRHNSGGRGSAWTSTVTVPTSDIPLNSSRNTSRHPSSARINPIHDSDPTNSPDIFAVTDARARSLVRNPSRAMERASGRFEYNYSQYPLRRLQREDNSENEEEEEESSGSEEEEEGDEGERPPVRMSLMSLLAEADEKIGIDGLAYMMEDEDDEDDEDDGGGEYNSCCVCMVRHKGAAFVPCGHTFCRLCSRDMWVEERGNNCPLCNNYILEILDIF
ncbi:hypothetical protein OROGR_027920 [Orobanche gracilis]